MDKEHTGIQLMNDDMLEAHRYYIKSKKYANKPMFGQTVRIYLPAHGDMNCPCSQCTCYRLSKGKQPIIKITLPPIKPANTKNNENE